MSLHKPRKRFGQNFLRDDNVIARIISSIAPKKEDHIIEIGPGQGALTNALANSQAIVDIVEIDHDLVPLLQKQFQNNTNVKIHEADALKFDFSLLCSEKDRARVVGNLPYNISTPLIFHLLSHQHCFEDMIFMLQKEVVARMAAKPHEHDYGRLSVMVQYYCEVDALFVIKPNAFFPPPKVDSQIIRLLPYDNKPFIAQNETLFATIVREAFGQRRKTLKNALKHIIPAELWQQIPCNISLRPEALGIDDYVNLANFLDNYSKSIRS